jgi:hypothetical protein
VIVKFKKLMILVLVLTIAFLSGLIASCDNDGNSAAENSGNDDASEPSLYISVNDFLQLPLSEYTTDFGNGGMWIDFINGEPAAIDGAFPENIFRNGNITIIGWAFDGIAMKPLSAMYVMIGDVSIKCDYGGVRSDVAEHFGNPDLAYTAFEVTIPVSAVQDSDKIEFILIFADGTHRFPHVEVKLRN